MIDGAVETHIALPAAGLMSQKPCAEVADEIAAVQSALDAISGGRLTLLATAVMALPVLPGGEFFPPGATGFPALPGPKSPPKVL